MDFGSELKYEGGADNWTVKCKYGSGSGTRDDDGERMVACNLCEILRGITASRSSKPFSGALLQMADKRMTRLAKMNVARKSNDFPIRSRYTSLIDMINTRGDEYPSDAHLDAHDHNSALRDPKELEKLSSCFKIKEPFKLVLAGPADRACQWKKDALCVYRDTLRAGIRLPFHPFIPLLLADVGISPCQLPPNSWRLILCYLSQCAKHNVPTSVAVFRKIFQFKNSPDKSPGWVSINQCPTIPHIVNGKSIPDNNLGWKKDFLFVIWEGGDWGSLFRSSFGLVVDGSPNDITLSQNLLSSGNWKEGLGYGDDKSEKGTEQIEPIVVKQTAKPKDKPTEVNIGLMTKKWLKYKQKEIKNVNKVKPPRKNRNGTEGVNKSNNYMHVPNAPRKKCYNCGNSNHPASFCRKNKNINSLPSKSRVKSQSVRFKPQNPCFHCGSLWHSIYTCKEYHSLYYDYYQIKPSLKKISIVASSVSSDAKSDTVNSDKKNVDINSDVKSAANVNKLNKAKGSKQVWVLKTNH
ncbi:hypothetical protein AgCh_013354 [Apium graveolens]